MVKQFITNLVTLALSNRATLSIAILVTNINLPSGFYQKVCKFTQIYYELSQLTLSSAVGFDLPAPR